MTKKDKIAKRLAEQLIQEGIVKPDEVDECLALTKEALVKQMGETRKSTTQLLSEPAEAVENKETMAIPSDFVPNVDNSYVLKVKGQLF